MGQSFDKLNSSHYQFISNQKIFFVATAPKVGRVNLSPKGMDCFRIIDDHTVLYLDVTGSSNETSAHIHDDGRVTMMFCSFDDKALILRLYGKGEVIQKKEDRWEKLLLLFPQYPGVRQIILLHVESIRESCGASIPFYDYRGERDELLNWLDNKGDKGIIDYQRINNIKSIDGHDTGLNV